MKCPDCDGTGLVTGLMEGECCSLCRGTGQIDRLPACDHTDCPRHECRRHPAVRFWQTFLSQAERKLFIVWATVAGSVALYLIGGMAWRLFQDMR